MRTLSFVTPLYITIFLSLLSTFVYANTSYANSGAIITQGDATKACCFCAQGTTNYNADFAKCTVGSTTTYTYKVTNATFDKAFYDSYTGVTALYPSGSAGNYLCSYFAPSAYLPMDGTNQFCGYGSTYSSNMFTYSYTAAAPQAPLCVVVGYKDNTTGLSMAVGKVQWWLFTDFFSLLDLYSSFGSLWFDNGYNGTALSYTTAWAPNIGLTRNNVVLQVEFAGFVSPLKHRWDNNMQYVVPYWTIIINVNKGKITGISWDDGCFTCSGAACIDSTCGQKAIFGAGDNFCDTPPNDCGVKLYVGWSGTDNNNNYLMSSGMKLSQFTKYSAMQAFNAAAQTYNQVNPVTFVTDPTKPTIPF
jgi:hypothetical protein